MTQNSNFGGGTLKPFLTCLVSTPLERPNTDCEASALELLEDYKPTTTSSLQELTSAPVRISYTLMSFTWFLSSGLLKTE